MEGTVSWWGVRGSRFEVPSTVVRLTSSSVHRRTTAVGLFSPAWHEWQPLPPWVRVPSNCLRNLRRSEGQAAGKRSYFKIVLNKYFRWSRANIRISTKKSETQTCRGLRHLTKDLNGNERFLCESNGTLVVFRAQKWMHDTYEQSLSPFISFHFVWAVSCAKWQRQSQWRSGPNGEGSGARSGWVEFCATRNATLPSTWPERGATMDDWAWLRASLLVCELHNRRGISEYIAYI